MKIGILTLSASDNCGSLLQTYALMKILQDEGNEVEVIDFTSKTAEKMCRIIHPGYIKQPKKFLGQFLRYKSLVNQRNAYEKFRNNYIRLSSQRYESAETMKELDGRYDLIVVGSDQVWNVYMRDFDAVFFLSWCNQSKRVSYAASLGDQKNGRVMDMIDKGLELKKFEAVSVRERSAVRRFKTELKTNVDLCLDPTLLLSRDEWEKLTDRSKQPKEDFIFYYSYNYGNEVKNDMVKLFSEKVGMPVYVINASRWVDGKEKNYGFRLFEHAGPNAFLNLMSGCKYSMVESFHGCIFSYIFQNEFWFLEDKKQLDDRINDLLDILDLSNRTLRPENIGQINFSEIIDYKVKRRGLTEQQEKSWDFIRKNLK